MSSERISFLQFEGKCLSFDCTLHLVEYYSQYRNDMDYPNDYLCLGSDDYEPYSFDEEGAKKLMRDILTQWWDDPKVGEIIDTIKCDSTKDDFYPNWVEIDGVEYDGRIFRGILEEVRAEKESQD